MAFSTTDEVNGALQEILQALNSSTHVWFRTDGHQIVPTRPHRRAVGGQQLRRWQSALRRLRTMPAVVRTVAADGRTYDLLMALASHPAPAVYLPATATLVNLGRLPPYVPLCDLIARLARDLEQYTYGLCAPAWWTRVAVAYRARAWESLCVRLAEQVFAEPILAALRNETTCADGLMPDIIVDDGVERDAAGRIVGARHIIEAKSGALPREIAYADRCEVLEYWHAGRHGVWITTLRAPCTLIYRSIDDLLAATEDNNGLADDIRAFAGQGNHVRLYLLFLRELLEREPTAQEAEQFIREGLQ